MVILKFRGIDNMEEAAKYKGRDLLVTRENAVPLEEGEFFICDITCVEEITPTLNKSSINKHSFPIHPYIVKRIYIPLLLLHFW